MRIVSSITRFEMSPRGPRVVQLLVSADVKRAGSGVEVGTVEACDAAREPVVLNVLEQLRAMSSLVVDFQSMETAEPSLLTA